MAAAATLYEKRKKKAKIEIVRGTGGRYLYRRVAKVNITVQINDQN